MFQRNPVNLIKNISLSKTPKTSDITKTNSSDQVQEQAQYEVDVFENQCELVQSIHKECDEPVDWASIVNSPPPFPIGEMT